MNARSNLTKPHGLRRGDTVGIVSPSSSPFEEGHIEFTYKWLESLGLKWKLGKHIFDIHSDFAGTDQDRLTDFHNMWSDGDVDAILPLRGGNGCVRLLPDLDFEMIAAKPKLLIGFSDITGLLIAIHQQTGLVTFHGPTAGNFFESAYTFHYFRKAVMDRGKPIGVIVDPPTAGWKPQYPPARLVIAEGRAQGQLTGGSLTVVKQLMGTPWEIETKDKIVFLEDVGEEPYAIDAMLCQLLLAGKLQKCAGIIFGESVGCKPGSSRRTVLPLNFSVERILKERLSGLGIPVVYGLRFGHGDRKFTLPLGVKAVLEARHKNVRFRIEEAATR
jgi:muramoyltetrapeptide carboxypeptidase